MKLRKCSLQHQRSVDPPVLSGEIVALLEDKEIHAEIEDNYLCVSVFLDGKEIRYGEKDLPAIQNTHKLLDTISYFMKKVASS